MSYDSTYISRAFQLLDIPVPDKPDVRFVYNFFVPDERINDDAPKSKRPITGLTPNDTLERIPRYVRLSWTGIQFDPVRSTNVPVSDEFIRQNVENISNESSITSDATILYFQDIDFRNRVGERFEASARVRGLPSGSATDTAARLNAVTSITSDGDIIQRYLSLASQSRKVFFKNGVEIEPTDAAAEEQLAMMIDNYYLSDSSREASLSPVSSAALIVKRNSKAITARSRRRSNRGPTVDELDPELPSVGDFSIITTYDLRNVEHHGYIIERYEVVDDAVKNKRTFYINNPSICTYVDTEVRYGIQYAYSIRTLISTYNTTISADTGQMQLSRFLFSSRPSTFAAVITEEYIPPDPPFDINFHWDYENLLLQISWAYPTNTQLDIKGWQIFRRSSIDEPFSLISQITFDDSVIKTPSTETVDPDLITTLDGPRNSYVDSEFDKDSKYIYSIVSVDAHALTSNYSAQFLISFDRVQNKLIRKRISPGNAPKQYPNNFLEAELSLDSVKSSEARAMRVYFDPEYLTVKDSKGTDLQLIKTTNRNGLYRFVLLNTDLQQQSNVDVKIEDLRNVTTT
jgi:hypothetical protein